MWMRSSKEAKLRGEGRWLLAFAHWQKMQMQHSGIAKG
jgi:hypothetical protein